MKPLPDNWQEIAAALSKPRPVLPTRPMSNRLPLDDDQSPCETCGEGPRRPANYLCNCHEPLMISIPPGRHIHIKCPVHGDRKIYGPSYRY